MLSIIILIYGKFIGSKSVSFLSVLNMFLVFLSSLFLFYEVILNNAITNLFLFKWIDIGYLNIFFSFYFDSLTIVMLIVVSFISLLVHLYSVGYMSHDPNFNRFMAYLSLFTFFMLILITADNYLLLFIGWEGVGLSSYLLINFWYLRLLANKAAIKAMLVNRVGDLALLIGISIIFFNFATINYLVIFNLINYLLNFYFIIFNYEFNLITIFSLFLFFGAMGKSAQLGLHMWLPDAMEGPTPVSALIHAATMVTAGVFLVVRNSYIFENTYNILLFISFIGGLTCFFSGIIGLFQFDIKKIVAYSTCSQLGYMFFSAGMSNYNVSLFHLFNHAFFKALLFLSMGSIIHALLDEQDLRKMGNLFFYLPITYIMVFIGTLSLLAFPFLTGFYSKDFLLEFVFSIYNINSLFMYLLGIVTAGLTAFYSFRLFFWVFLSKTNMYRINMYFLNEINIFMLLAMLFLFFASILIGYLCFDAFLGLGSLFLINTVYINIVNYSIINAEFSLFFIKYIALFVTLFGIFLFFFFNKFFFNYFFFKNNYFYNIYFFFNKAFFFDYIWNNIFLNNIFKYSFFYIYKYIEKGLFELYGPIYFIWYLNYFYNFFKLYNTGLIYNYIFFILWFILIFIIFFELFIFFNYNFIYLLISILFLFNYGRREKSN
jgi:proton-translocating NADH-quinone oxidoreductase chain L